MYLPSHFEEPRRDALHKLIEHNPLGILFTHNEGGMDANHIPFLLDSKQEAMGVLHSHVARANAVWKDVRHGDEVLVVFRAADAYISPSWYPSKHETQRQVPTWNYMVAHAYGKITVRDDERYVRAMVARLTRVHESTRERPWKMTDAPRDYMETLVKAIVGLEIEITRLIGKSKLSQDDGTRDMIGAGLGLKAQGDAFIGDAMIAQANGSSG